MEQIKHPIGINPHSAAGGRRIGVITHGIAESCAKRRFEEGVIFLTAGIIIIVVAVEWPRLSRSTSFAFRSGLYYINARLCGFRRFAGVVVTCCRCRAVGNHRFAGTSPCAFRWVCIVVVVVQSRLRLRRSFLVS